jgi:hypothetical protein
MIDDRSARQHHVLDSSGWLEYLADSIIWRPREHTMLSSGPRIWISRD